MTRRVLTILLASLSIAASVLLVPGTAAAASSDETVYLYSCDRGARAVVTVTWISSTTVDLTWRLEDRNADGRSPNLRMTAVDYNGSGDSLRTRYFDGDGAAVLTSGYGTSKSGGRTWNPSGIDDLNELEIWVVNGVYGDRVACGWEFSHRLNNYIHADQHNAPSSMSYADSKPLRDRIVSHAQSAAARGYHERYGNCNKYSDSFTSPNVCRPWCADFAWSMWRDAGVDFADAWNSSYANDFKNEWKIRFKPVNGDRLPVPGDVVVYSHNIAGVNGHVAIVTAVDGWWIKTVHGNYGDRIVSEGWVDSRTRSWESSGGYKFAIGFAAPV